MGIIYTKIIEIRQDLNDVEYGLVELRDYYKETGVVIKVGMYKELPQAYTNKIDREKIEKAEIEELRKKALKSGVEISNHIFRDKDLWNVKHSTIKHMIEDEIEFQMQKSGFKEGIMRADGTVEWREMK